MLLIICDVISAMETTIAYSTIFHSMFLIVWFEVNNTDDLEF
jgi:hypothetical protein